MEEKKPTDNCEIELREINGKRFFKCKNTSREPTAEEIIQEVSKNSKIVYNLD